MQRTNAKGFTLIEMLVVIAIIAILATGATAVYTSSLQKSRDTTRMQDVTALKSGIEQYYMDNAVYPSHSSSADLKGVNLYVQNFPKDAKSGQTGSSPSSASGANKSSYLDYSYASGPDSNGVTLQQYKISTAFENEGNTLSKAGNDGGNDGWRWEVGVMWTGASNLDVSATGTVASSVASCAAITNTSAVAIRGNCP